MNTTRKQWQQRQRRRCRWRPKKVSKQKRNELRRAFQTAYRMLFSLPEVSNIHIAKKRREKSITFNKNSRERSKRSAYKESAIYVCIHIPGKMWHCSVALLLPRLPASQRCCSRDLTIYFVIFSRTRSFILVQNSLLSQLLLCVVGCCVCFFIVFLSLFLSFLFESICVSRCFARLFIRLFENSWSFISNRRRYSDISIYAHFICLALFRT